MFQTAVWIRSNWISAGAEGGNGSSVFILRHFLATIERLKGLGSIHKSKAAYL